MSGMLRSYGVGLSTLFFTATAVWALLLIVLPQFAMLDKSLRKPPRQLDSSIAYTLMNDARTCRTVLETLRAAEAGADEPQAGSDSGPAIPSPSAMGTGGDGGLAVPSPSMMGTQARTQEQDAAAGPEPTQSDGGLAIPSPSAMSTGGASGGLAVPSPGGMATGGAGTEKTYRPYTLQCDRATTEQRLVRDPDAPTEYLHTTYDLPSIDVPATLPVDQQLARADEVREIAEALYERLIAEEANALPYGFTNYAQISEARLIPLSPETLDREDARFVKQMQNTVGLRSSDGGVVHERLTLITLLKTIMFAVLATAFALLVCYPIAFNLALEAGPRQLAWLFLALIIPYAIVELMRVYAWVTIIDNNGLINRLLDWLGMIDLEAGEAIAFKRSSITVFVVIIYTYNLFMVLPLYNVMSTLSRSQIEAARDLGASTWRVHTRVIIPHAKPGIAVGCIATFMLSAGAFSVPRIISRGLQGEWFTQTIYNKFFESENSNLGAAYAFAYTLLCFAIVGLFMWLMRARLKDFMRA